MRRAPPPRRLNSYTASNSSSTSSKLDPLSPRTPTTPNTPNGFDQSWNEKDSSFPQVPPSSEEDNKTVNSATSASVSEVKVEEVKSQSSSSMSWGSLNMLSQEVWRRVDCLSIYLSIYLYIYLGLERIIPLRYTYARILFFCHITYIYHTCVICLYHPTTTLTCVCLKHHHHQQQHPISCWICQGCEVPVRASCGVVVKSPWATQWFKPQHQTPSLMLGTG
jgi:hypothetical protein